MSARPAPLCPQVSEWIALGRPPGADAAAFADHVATCEPCAREAAFDRELERALGSDLVADTLTAPAVRAPDGFTASVMARVAAAEAVRSRTAPLLPPLAPALPWWARALADPAAVVGLALAALALWQRANLVTLASGFALRTSDSLAALRAAVALPASSGAATAWESVARVLAQPWVAAGLALALAPVVAWTVFVAMRWGERPR